jgi:hypothetical protein
MARGKLLECAFLIPIRRDATISDGLPHKRSAWYWLDRQLLPFRGGTRALSLYLGWYVDPNLGKIVRDRSRRYEVALSRKETARLRRVLREACGVFEQKCIYLSVAGVVEFVKKQAK